MKKYLLLILGLIVISITSCNLPKQDYIGVNEYCCEEVCCEGYEHFEDYYVGNNTEDYYQRADQFFCDVYKLNDTKLYISNIDIVRNGYCVDCSNIYTLSPNGAITHRCPLGYKADLPIECSSCERSEYCKPCHLHKHCPFPHNFEKLIKS